MSGGAQAAAILHKIHAFLHFCDAASDCALQRAGA
jgi:hypothetical protein